MQKFSSRRIAVTAMFLALLAVFSFTPLGFFPIIPGLVSTAFIIIVIVTLSAQLEGLLVGVICTTAFGLFSFIRAWVTPDTLTAFIFQNPLISVLPRIVMGFATYYSMLGMKKLTANSQKAFVKNQLPSLVSAIAAVVSNTALVVGGMAVGYGGEMLSDGSRTVMQMITGTTLAINFPIELALNIIFVPMLYTVLKKYAYKGE